jgi:hypothetical protein
MNTVGVALAVVLTPLSIYSTARGSALTQGVGRRPGGQSGTGAGLSEYLGFPYQFSFHRLLHTHHPSSGAGTMGKMVADVPNELTITSPQESENKITILQNFVLSSSWNRLCLVCSALLRENVGPSVLNAAVLCRFCFNKSMKPVNLILSKCELGYCHYPRQANLHYRELAQSMKNVVFWDVAPC